MTDYKELVADLRDFEDSLDDSAADAIEALTAALAAKDKRIAALRAIADWRQCTADCRNAGLPKGGHLIDCLSAKIDELLARDDAAAKQTDLGGTK